MGSVAYKLMKSKIKIGDVFERLKVLEDLGSTHGSKYWLCECIDGNLLPVTTANLSSGNTQSCGCFRREKTIARFTTHGGTVHGRRIPEYRVWQAMIARCDDSNDPAYKWYGARGISVSADWYDFAKFISDMGRRPYKNFTIERIDNNSGYCKINCKWASRIEQANNTRANVRFVRGDETRTIAQWVEYLNVSASMLYARHARGLPDSEVLA